MPVLAIRKPRRRALCALPCLLVLAATAAAAPSAHAGALERLSVTSAGLDASGTSSTALLDHAGRYVAFTSSAPDIVDGDTNLRSDVFVRDRKHGTVTRASVADDGSEARNTSLGLSLSANGRLLLFMSAASNLVPDDGNGFADLFLRDLKKGTTTRVSVDASGVEANERSLTGTLSGNGNVLVFTSVASNLVAGDDNAAADVFVRDLKSGAVSRVSVGPGGVQANASSSLSFCMTLGKNGQVVPFASQASNLVDGDTNGVLDVFVHDAKSGGTERVSVASDGGEGNGDSLHGTVSANGRLVAFDSSATNLVPGDTNGKSDVFVFDRKTGVTERVSVASDGSESNGGSTSPSISADGRWVAFSSAASNLVADDANGVRDVFLHDRKTGKTTRLSTDAAGNGGNGGSNLPCVSANGRFVAFDSDASNLVVDDGNGKTDVFLLDRK
jgi:Tol biopolymer transport system component